MTFNLRYLVTSIAFFIALLSSQATLSDQSPAEDAITVYTASKIITMDPTNPVATSVAVRGKRIVAVGSMEDLQPWMDNYSYTVDERFADKILMPGLIDPHLHPMLGAIQLRTKWITPESWSLHDETVEGVTTPEVFHIKLREQLAKEKRQVQIVYYLGLVRALSRAVDTLNA